MKDSSRTKQELLEENSFLKQRIKKLESPKSSPKEINEALFESEARYRAVVESSFNGVYIIQDDLFRYVNKRFCEIYGYTYNEIVDKINPLDLVHPEDRSIVEENLRKRFSGESDHAEWEMRAIGKDGKIINVKVFGYSIPYKGRPAGSGTVIDITEYKRAEEALYISQARLFEAMDLAKIVYWELYPTDNVFIFNDAFYAFYGTTAEKEGGYRMTREEYTKRFVHPEDQFPLLQLIQERSKTPGPEILPDIEHRIVRQDGEVRHILVRAMAVKDASGHIIKRYGANQDITHRKQAEEEKRRLETQLLQAQKMEALGTLTGGIAHDFNNVLSVLMGYAVLLKMKTDDGTLQSYVDQILSSSQKAVDLIQSLLTFSRQQAIRLRPTSIHSIIKNTEKLLGRLVTEDILIKTRLAEEDAIIMADATQIDQILFNLAGNARDAMPQGGVLTIETKKVELTDMFQRSHGYGELGQYILLSVTDTGVGMDNATQKRIFDPFFTTKEVGKGTGLGLSTVYGAVKQHNGYITVNSEPGKGTTFHIYLPIIDNAPKEKSEVSLSVERGNETILVAEDNDAVRDLIRDVLVQYGYTVIEAIDGMDAIEKFKDGSEIDLLILDSVMPKKNGHEVYEELIRISPDIKVLFTSGYTKDVFLDKGIENEKYEFVPKPILPDALLHKVRKVLDS